MLRSISFVNLLFFLKRKKISLFEMTVLCVCLALQILDELTEFYKTRYESLLYEPVTTSELHQFS